MTSLTLGVPGLYRAFSFAVRIRSRGCCAQNDTPMFRRGNLRALVPRKVIFDQNPRHGPKGLASGEALIKASRVFVLSFGKTNKRLRV